jgi:cbb3-type cytochrome oxidase maturation protein
VTIIHLLIPISLLVAGAFLIAFIRAVRTGQYDDTDTPALRMLLDDPPPSSNLTENPKQDP